MTREDKLQDAIAAFGEVWLDDDNRPFLRLCDPAPAEKLDQIESLLGGEIPRSVRLVLETLDGSFCSPVSPCRPDHLLSASEISIRIHGDGPCDVIPIIERGLDPVTGMSLLLGVSLADPWGPLVAGDGFEYPDTTPHTLLDWFEQVIAETRAYEWPEPLALTVRPTLSALAMISEAVLGQLPVGTGVLVMVPEPVKRNRMKLRLFLQLEPGVWALGHSRQGDDHPTIDERCIEACTVIARETRRHRSQWTLTTADVAAKIRPDREMYTVVVAMGRE